MNRREISIVIEALNLITRECALHEDVQERECKDCVFRDREDTCLFDDLTPVDFDVVSTIIRHRRNHNEHIHRQEG